MPIKDEALKMAIKTLEAFEITGYCDETIKACKEALEQPPSEVEPFDVWAGTNPKRTYEDKNKVYIAINVMHKDKLIHLLRIQRNEDKKYYIELNDLMRFINMSNSKLEQPAQEPVAYKHEIFINGRCAETWYDDIKNPASDTKIIPLYTHPAPSSYQSNGKLSYSEELAYQAGFEAGREFERGCDD